MSAPDPARRRAFAVVFAALMSTAAGGNALVSVLPAIGREIGVSDTLIAAVFSLSALFWTFSAPLWARKSDRVGRRPMIMLGLGGYALSMLLFGLVVMAGLHKLAAPVAVFAGMATARALYGLLGSAASTSAQAYVADRTAPEERTDALALVASAFGLGTITGPALAPFFVLPGVGLAGPMFCFAVIGVCVLWAAWRWLPAGDYIATPQGERPTHATAPRLGLWRDPRVAPFLMWGLAAGSAQAVNGQVLGFHVIDRLHMSPAEAQSFIGLAMFGGAAATLAAQWGLIRLLHLSPRALLRWGAALALLGNLAAGFAHDYYGVVMGFALLSLGYGFTRPGFTAGASLAVGPAEQGAVAGAVAAVNGACWLVAPVVGVALYEWRAPSPYLLNAAILLALAAAAFAVKALATAGQRPASMAPGVDEPQAKP
ncbi:MFS transporter [Caulobacter sp. 17J80-11]|uniref:MFS transporter n=1 Tax=Caulobacter sp. 17J80-11 TaxID=2763502 RepID=UPI0016534682|nr:MFS transporter [Caulobacter sp. 17J80-11]